MPPRRTPINYYWVGDNTTNRILWNATTGLGGTNWSSSGDFNNGTAGILTYNSDTIHQER